MPFQKGNKLGGRPKGAICPNKQLIRDIFIKAAPELVVLAIKRAKGYYDENEKWVPGDNMLLKELIKKALPDQIEADLKVKDPLIIHVMRTSTNGQD